MQIKTAMEGESGKRDSAASPPALSSAFFVDANSGIRGSSRWWVAVGCGAALSFPLGWILSYAAALPFMLGLFFFVLLGMVVGAVVHRIAAAGRPYSKTQVVIGTSVIVLAAWTTSIVKESRDFPHDVAGSVLGRTQDLRGKTPTEFRKQVADDVSGCLSRLYPPGGVLGYARWALLDGSLRVAQVPALGKEITLPQVRFWWAIRVILSLAFLGFGIGSLTFPMIEQTPRVSKLE